MKEQTIADLKAARDLISDPKRWTRWHFARDINQEYVPAWHHAAVCWCSAGAIQKVIGFDALTPADSEIDQRRINCRVALNYVLDNGMSYVDANDRYDHAAALSVFDRGIARLENEP